MIADGAMIGFGPCVVCRRVFAFDVDRVPSWAGKPICRSCLRDVNARKRERGMPEWKEPAGAYPLDDTNGDGD